MNSTRKSILFIVNPISGGISKTNFPELLKKHLDHSLFQSEIILWDADIDAATLAKKGIDDGFDIIAAVGGDGTIHQVGSALIGAKAALAIIPMGSGNGLARHLRIPIKTAEALRSLKHMQVMQMDAAQMNGKPFLNIAGMGFDAHIGHLFDAAKTRGLITYTAITVRELWNYKPAGYQLIWPGGSLQTDAFFISVCNGSQWGNNARVARSASVSDGLLQIVVCYPFKALQVPGLVSKIFLGGMENSRNFHFINAASIKIIRGDAGPVHMDGEPNSEKEVLEFSVLPKAINVLRPVKE